MALNGQYTTVNYTPFNKVGFGLSNPISGYSQFPNSTDVVDVKITAYQHNMTGGHVSTPVFGTAISTYNSSRKEWFVRGQRDDVNAVLNQLVFYPPPNNTYSNWSVLPTVLVNRTYQTTQTPPSIPNISQTLYLYQPGGSQYIDYGGVVFDADIDYVYYHPYMSSLPSTENVTEASVTRAYFGIIGNANMTDRNITITCEAFTSFNGTTWSNSGGQYISFFDDDLYVGDKKSETPQGLEEFRFTGTVQECQSFLDSIQLRKSSGSPDVYLKIGLLDGLTYNYYSKLLT